MDRLSSVLMVLAGTALGAFSVLPAPHPPPNGRGQQIAYVAAPDDVATIGGETVIVRTPAKTEHAAVERIRIFSPKYPLVREPGRAISPSQPTGSTWTAVVTPGAPSSARLSSPRPSDSDARSALASDLQRELQRVGCYAGEINGGWTTSTRHAMAAFMERVNATLPIQEPDYILLTLVQNHKGLACGNGCPSDQVEMANGQCRPKAVLARAERRSRALQAKHNSQVASHAASKSAERRTAAVSADTETLPWQTTADAGSASRVAADTTEQFSGRMSVGGPIAPQARTARTVTGRASAIVPPAPRPAIRPQPPVRQAALDEGEPATTASTPVWSATAGLPGSKSGIAVKRASKPVAKKNSYRRSKYSNSRNYKKRNRQYRAAESRRHYRRRETRYYIQRELGGFY